MAQQSADDLKWHILINEAHPNRMAKLVRSEVVKLLTSVFDFVLQRPGVQMVAKRFLVVGFRLHKGRGKEIGTGISPLCSNILLLGLDGCDQLFFHQGNDMLSMGFALVKA